MNVNIALIPSDLLSEAHRLASTLQTAVEGGDMRVVDTTTDALLALAGDGCHLSLSEAAWHQLIEHVRHTVGDFHSDYLLAKPQLEMMLTAGMADFVGVAEIIRQALATESVLLQLPAEEDESDV